MTYRPLKRKANRYVTQNGSYSVTDGLYYAQTEKGTNQKIKTSGTERDFGIDDLIVVDGVDIYFVVKVNEEYYTSQRLKDDLILADEERNPYFSLDYVTVMEINQDRINKQLDNRRDNGEQTAGVYVVATLDNPIDIVKQIDWATRPVSISGDESSHVVSIGEWTVDRLGDEIYTFENSVKITEPDPRTDFDDDDDDENGDNGDEGEDRSRNPRRPGSRTRSEPRRDQPRSGGGGGLGDPDGDVAPIQNPDIR